jgi:hypothetical protein
LRKDSDLPAGLALFETGSIVPHPADRRAFAAQLALYAGKPPAG